MTQAELYALVARHRYNTREYGGLYDRVDVFFGPALHALGIYGKRTMRAKLREVDAWRTDPIRAGWMALDPRPKTWLLSL